MKRQVANLRRQLEELRDRISVLEGGLVVVREISRDEAKREIARYFRSKRDAAYPSDAAIALGLDAALTRDLCRELVEEGLLAG